MSIDHHPSARYEVPRHEADQTDDPLLLRFAPGVAHQFAEVSGRGDYGVHREAIQSRLREEAAKIGRLDTGGYGIVEDPEGRHYISLFPEDLGARLTEAERQQQGLPELAQESGAELAADEDHTYGSADIEPDFEKKTPREDEAADFQQQQAVDKISHEAQQLAVSASDPSVETPREREIPTPDLSFVHTEQKRDHSSMEAEDVGEMQRLSDKIDEGLDHLTTPETESQITEFGSGENAVRGLIESLKTELDLFQRGRSNRVRTANELETLVNDLNTRYNLQAAKFQEVLDAPTQTMKNQMEAETLYDARTFLAKQAEAGFGTDVGQMGVLKERIKRTQDLADAQWGSVRGINQQSEERKTIGLYTLRPLVQEFRDANWGLETVVVQLKAAIEKLDGMGDTINSRYRVYRETLDEAKRIIQIKK